MSSFSQSTASHWVQLTLITPIVTRGGRPIRSLPELAQDRGLGALASAAGHDNLVIRAG